MGQRAQAALEYLLTYGWALVLIATVIGALVFIISSPASNVTFSSSDPAKILVKGGAVSGTDAEILLQNITGGKVSVTKITLPASYVGASCSLNGAAISTGGPISPAIEVMAGGEIDVECSGLTENPSGRIDIDYTDFAGLERSVEITGSSSTEAPAPPACSGYLWDGHCWYEGALDESCITVCSTHGGNLGTCQENDNATCDLCLHFHPNAEECMSFDSSMGPFIQDQGPGYCTYRPGSTAGDCSVLDSIYNRFCACNE